ncbi:hypothetical protein Tco_0811046, partial [Tanacetum coccineum]
MSANDNFSLHDDEEFLFMMMHLWMDLYQHQQRKNSFLKKKRKARHYLLMAVPKRSSQSFHGMDVPRDLGSHQDTVWWFNANSKTKCKYRCLKNNSLRHIYYSSKDAWRKRDKINCGRADLQYEELNHALMAFTVNNEVSMCSKLCLDSYNALQAKYDELQYEFGDHEAALTAHKLGYYDIPLYSRFKQVEYKGVPHPLSGDYTPREQEDIDDSLYEYGNMDLNLYLLSSTVSTHYSTCQSNDSDWELGTVSDHSVNDDPIHDHISIPSIEQVTIATQKTQPQMPKPIQTVDPSCAQHVKSPRQPIRTPVNSSPIPSNNRQNWNQRMERDLGAGYSFERKPCFVCGSLSHLIKDCDYYEKKMAREAALKSKRVFHADVRQATPAWTNANRVNKANQFTPRPVQLSNIRPNRSTVSRTVKTGRVNVNTGHGNVSSGNMHVNSGTQIKSGASRFNTGKQHVSSGRVNRPVSNNTSPKPSQVNLNSPKKCFSKQRSLVNRPFSRNTAHKSNIYAVKGKMGTAVKTSAGCVWRKITPLSNTNSGPTPDSCSCVRLDNTCYVQMLMFLEDHPLKHMEHRGIFDSGCSGHMTGNRAHLEDYQDLSKV